MTGPGQLAFAFPRRLLRRGRFRAGSRIGRGARLARALARLAVRTAGALGAGGAGKSHLAAIWAARTQAAVLPAEALASAEPPALIGAARHVVVEDGDRILGAAAAERGLLHLLNLVAEGAGRCC